MKRQVAAWCLVTALAGMPGCKRKPKPLISEIHASESLPADRMWGVYEAQGLWRWTSRSFGFLLDPPRTERAIYLELDLNIPDEILDDAPVVGLSAQVNGTEVGRQIYKRTGRYYFTRHVPLTALLQRPARVVFELDRSTPRAKAGGNSPGAKEQGIIFVSAGLKDYEQTAECRDSRNWLAKQASAKVLQEAGQIPTARVVELRKLFFSLPALEHLDFQGVPVDTNPLDLWMMQQVAFEVRPQYVVLTGTGEGGVALYWANILNGAGMASSRVLSVDRKNRATQASKNPLWARYVETIEADPTDTALLSRLSGRLKGATTLAVIDAGGDVSAVLNEITAYAPLVSRGSYLVVANTAHDTETTDRPRSAGPSEAVRRFLASGGAANFDVDASRDMLILTSSPGGWLRRK